MLSKKRRTIFDFVKNPEVGSIDREQTQQIKGGGSTWDMIVKAFKYEWEKANRPEPTLKEMVNAGSNGAVR